MKGKFIVIATLQTFNGWKNSSGHEQAMTDSYSRYMGVSVYCKNGRTYVIGAFSDK